MFTIKPTLNICPSMWGSTVFDNKRYVVFVYLLMICVNGIGLVSFLVKWNAVGVCAMLSTLRIALAAHQLVLAIGDSIHLMWTNVYLLLIVSFLV